MNLKKSLLLVLFVLIIDQASKIYIKTHFILGEYVNVIGDWFKIYFVENNGMAFGAEFGGIYGKLFLTVFRIVAISGIFYWLWKSLKNNEHKFLIVSISLILAGAIGNILDSVFYGHFFTDSMHQVATAFPKHGYAPWFQGKVVDMFYFPLFNVNIPETLPFIGGKHFTFFEPVFNVADSAITIGVSILLLFNKRIFGNKKNNTKDNYHKTIDEIIKDNNNSIA